MEHIEILKALFLGFIEGLTEFLPISSTGHLILFGHLIDFHSDDGRVFEVVIQLGAILAVCWLYRQKIHFILIRAKWIDSTKIQYVLKRFAHFHAIGNIFRRCQRSR